MAEDLSEKGRAYIAVVVVLTLLATVAVALRFLVRWRQLQKPGLDDWTILTALSLEYAMAVEAILWASAGKIGFPTKELTSDQITTFFKVDLLPLLPCAECHDGKTFTDHCIAFLRQPNHV